MPMSWIISAASAPTMWQPSTRPLPRCTTSFINVRSALPVSVAFIGRKFVL